MDYNLLLMSEGAAVAGPVGSTGYCDGQCCTGTCVEDYDGDASGTYTCCASSSPPPVSLECMSARVWIKTFGKATADRSLFSPCFASILFISLCPVYHYIAQFPMCNGREPLQLVAS